MAPLIVLRPEPGASETAARATALGLAVRKCPLFDTVGLRWDAPDAARFDAAMMTSAAAARWGGRGLGGYRQLPLYAVGAATAAAAERIGFTTAHNGTGDAAALIAAIATDRRRSVLYFAGRERTALLTPPFRIETVSVYASDPVAAPDLPDHGVALVHSVRRRSVLPRW